MAGGVEWGWGVGWLGWVLGWLGGFRWLVGWLPAGRVWILPIELGGLFIASG